MNYEYSGSPNHNDNTARKRGSLGLVFFIPIFILILLFLVLPMVTTFFRSFTNYNIIRDPEIIMFKNYQNIFRDEVSQIKILNTLITFVFSVPLTVSVTFLLAWLSSKINRVFRYIIAIMLLVASITSISPTGLVYFISSTGIDMTNVLSSPVLSRIFINLIPFFMGIGPLYLLFTIGYLMKDRIIKYLHIAVSLQLILSVLSFFSTRLIGLPSPGYYGDNLLGAIYDYSFIRFELGYSSALSILLLILLVIFMALYNGFVLVIGMLQRSSGVDRQAALEIKQQANTTSSVAGVLIFVVLLVFSICLLLPFIQLLLQTELKNYQGVLISRGSMFRTAFFNSIITIFLSTILLSVVTFLSGIGTSTLTLGARKMILPLATLTFLLSPCAILYINRSDLQMANILFLAVPAIIKSLSFGLCIFLGSLMAKHLTKSNQQSRLLSSVLTGKSLLCILSLSLIASLASWFYPIQWSGNMDKATLYQMYPYMASLDYNSAGSSAYLILTLLVPVLIIIIFTPLLLSSLHKRAENINADDIKTDIA